MASLMLPYQPLLDLSPPSRSHLLPQDSPYFHCPRKPSSTTERASFSRRHIVSFALSESDSPKYLYSNSQALLRELADSFDLPPDYLAQLPRDLRLDLNDAAFDLSNGPVIDECGQELGEVLLNLSRAWELVDASSCLALARDLSLLGSTLPDSAKSAFGKRLLSAGRRFYSMGQYGQGELRRIAEAMTAAGKLLSAHTESSSTDKQEMKEARMVKFGELQVEVTADRASIGAVIGILFGFLSWQLGQGIQNIPESSMQYANENAFMLAKSLRGAMLVLFYSSTALSVITSAGLLLLALQLNSKGK